MKKVLVVEVKEEQQNTLHVIAAVCYDIGNSTDSIASGGRRIGSNELGRCESKL
jgi:hypothetical protein